MRGEVLQLSSNVNVTSSKDSVEHHGCHILVADFFEPHDFTYRAGNVHFDNVAVHNCSQHKMAHSGIAFVSALKGTKVVTNSAFSHGLGKGISVAGSANIILDGNVIHDFYNFGITGSAVDFTVNNNVVSFIKPTPHKGYNKWEQSNGGLIIGDLEDPSVLMTNNIVSSAW